MGMPYCVGLTGGIGSGKSSAAEIFRELGVAVVDTDEIAHELTQRGGSALGAIEREFGPGFLAADGGLDRQKMRQRVFADGRARHALENILHPLIRRQAAARVAQAQQPYVLLVVPLLLETGAYRDLIHRVLVVDCDEQQQIDRATRRSALGADEVRAIMAAQLPRAERAAAADDVLRNDTDIEALRAQVKALHLRYLSLARRAAAGGDTKRRRTPENPE